MTRTQAISKRTLDLVIAVTGLLLAGWLVALAVVIARLDTGASGLFRHHRVGRNGRLFTIYKIRTMVPSQHATTVTQRGDPRISRFGRIFRKLKLDELPQLINVIRGDMSLVGPRPDVPGYADKLNGEERVLLSVRPGITGPATLIYRNEEDLLAQHPDPERYNAEVIWPDKVRLNLDYIRNWRLRLDLLCLLETVFPRLGRYPPYTRTDAPSRIKEVKETL